MRKALIGMACCGALLGVALEPATAQAGTRDCRNYRFDPAFIYDFSVRSMTCKRAEYLQRTSIRRSASPLPSCSVKGTERAFGRRMANPSSRGPTIEESRRFGDIPRLWP